MGRRWQGCSRYQALARRRLAIEHLELRHMLAGSLEVDVFHDVDQNGVRDAEDPAQSGLVVELVRSVDDQISNDDDSIVDRSVSDESGHIVFSELTEGNYFYRVRPPVGYQLVPLDVGEDETVDSDVDPQTGLSQMLAIAGDTTLEETVGLSGSPLLFGTAFSFGSSDGILGNGFVDVGRVVRTDAANNIIVAGSFVGTVDFDNGPATRTIQSAGGSDAFVAKFTSGGALLWAESIGSSANDQSRSIAIGADGDVLLSGLVAGDVTFNGQTYTGRGSSDGFVARFDDQGNGDWLELIGGSQADLVNTLIVDVQRSQLVVGGRFRDTVTFDETVSRTSQGSNDAFLLGLNLEGDFRWVQTAGGTGSSDEIIDLAVSSTGDVTALGRFSNTITFGPAQNQQSLSSAGRADGFVWQLDGAGTHQAAVGFHGSDNLFPKGIALDPFGNVLAAGSYRGTIDFDPGPATHALTSLGQSDIFVVKLDSNLQMQWARSMGGIASDQANAISVNSAGFVITSGYLGGTADLDPGEDDYLITPNGKPGFVSRLNGAGEFVAAESWALVSESVAAAEGPLILTGSFADSAEVAAGFSLQSNGGNDVFIVQFARNQEPVAFSATVTAVEDITLPITLTADDGDPAVDQQLTYTLTSLPATGSLALVESGLPIAASQLPLNLNSPTVYFTTAANSVDQQQFGFRVTDDGGTDNGGINTSQVATVTVDVTPVNDPPSGNSQTLSTLDQVPLRVPLSGDDGDPETQQTLTYTLVSLPATGLLSLAPNDPPISESDLPLLLAGNELHFFNDAGDLSTQSFDFQVSDDGGTDNGGIDTGPPASITIEVLSNEQPPLNHQPSADSQQLVVVEDVPQSITLTGDDGDDDRFQTLSYLVTQLPSLGSLRPTPLSPPLLSEELPYRLPSDEVFFQTAANEVSAQQFQFQVQDNGGTAGGGTDLSSSAAVSVGVTPVNDAPFVTSDELQAYEDTLTALPLTADDGDPEVEQQLTFTLTKLPAAGLLRSSASGPVIQMEELPVELPGSLVFFEPVAGSLESQTISLMVRDNGGTDLGGVDQSAEITATIEVLPVNDPPVADAQQVQALEDVPTPILLTGNDGDPEVEQALSFIVTQLPMTGFISASMEGVPVTTEDLPWPAPSPTVYFTTANNDVTSQQFAFRVRDDGGTEHGGIDESDEATIDIDVTPVNDPPSLISRQFQTPEDTPLAIGLVGDDGDPELDQVLRFVIVSLPGTAEIRTNDGQILLTEELLPYELSSTDLEVTPANDDISEQAFEVQVWDDGGRENGGYDVSESTPVIISIDSVNDRPNAHDGSYELIEDLSLDLTLVGDDGGDGNQELSFTLLGLPAEGSLRTPAGQTVTADQLPMLLSGPELVFVPALNDVETRTFQFQVQDDGGVARGGQDTSEPATITIDILPQNDRPVLQGPEQWTVGTYQFLSLTGFVLDDVDAGETVVSLNFEVDNGQLFVDDSVLADTSYVVQGQGSPSLQIEATVAGLQGLMAGGGVSYRSPNIFAGTAQATALLDDRGSTGAGGALAASWSGEIVVQSLYSWHNVALPLDVNNDGAVSPVDVLLVINRLNTQSGSSDFPSDETAPPYYDTNRDNQLTPVDALLIINHLNRFPEGEGEDQRTVSSRASDPSLDPINGIASSASRRNSKPLPALDQALIRQDDVVDHIWSQPFDWRERAFQSDDRESSTAGESIDSDRVDDFWDRVGYGL